MTERDKNIQTLADSINSSLDHCKKENLQMVQDNYDSIKHIMQDVISDLYDAPEQETDRVSKDYIVQVYFNLWKLEAIHMIKEMKKGARG